MKVPLLDLKPQYQQIKEEVEPVIREICEAQAFILGPKVQECEAAVAEYCGAACGLGVSSGSDALLIALMAEGIGPGDEVITTSYSFFATVGAIARTGATVVFVDIDPVTYNIDPSKLEAAVTPKTRAIIPVHLYGQMADMDAVTTVAKAHGLIVIEDAAQAIGSEWKGRRAGSIGDYGCFSFFPSKNLGCFGDGGMVTMQDEKKARHAAILRNHGMDPKYYHHEIGGNFRLDALQAAVVTIKLRHLDGWTAARQANAARYKRLFEAAGLVQSGAVSLPVEGENRHIYNQYIVRSPDRDGLLEHLRSREVGCEVYYPVPLHLQECFRPLGYAEGAFPEAERAARETLALPIYPDLTDEMAGRVVEVIAEFARG